HRAGDGRRRQAGLPRRGGAQGAAAPDHRLTPVAVLSVIVPVRDGERFVADALASLTRNFRPGFEFIVVDDGSADDTAAVVEDFRADLPGPAVFRNPEPLGLADAPNTGLEGGSGR